jgi:hypothetical protein
MSLTMLLEAFGIEHDTSPNWKKISPDYRGKTKKDMRRHLESLGAEFDAVVLLKKDDSAFEAEERPLGLVPDRAVYRGLTHAASTSKAIPVFYLPQQAVK